MHDSLIAPRLAGGGGVSNAAMKSAERLPVGVLAIGGGHSCKNILGTRSNKFLLSEQGFVFGVVMFA